MNGGFAGNLRSDGQDARIGTGGTFKHSQQNQAYLNKIFQSYFLSST
jgi:hypothetical protein